MEKVKKALQLALDAIQRADDYGVPRLTPTVIAIQDALAELEQPSAGQSAEPVGYITGWIGGHLVIRLLDPALVLPSNTALYLQSQSVPDATVEQAYIVSDELKTKVIELCRLTLLNGSVDGIVTHTMEQMAEQIREMMGAV